MLTGLNAIKKFFPLRSLYLISAVTGLAVLSFITFSPYIPFNIKLNVNDTAPETVASPRYIEFVSKDDKVQTEDLRNQRAALVEPVYSIDPEINKKVLSSIVNFYTLARQYQTDRIKDGLVPIPAELDFVSAREWDRIVSLDAKVFASLEFITLETTDKLLRSGQKEVSSLSIKTQVLQHIKRLGLGNTLNRFVWEVVAQFMAPNFVYDEAKTNDLIRKEMDMIQPFTTSFKEGEPIIYKGEVVTEKHIEILKALNIYGAQANFTQFFGIFLYCALLFLLFERFIYYFKPKLHKKPSKYIAIFTISILVLFTSRLLLNITSVPPNVELQYLIPIPIIAMTVSLLVSHNLAMLTGTIISIFIALMYQGDFNLFLFLFLSNAAATFASFKIIKRTELIRAGNIIGAFNIILVLSLGILQESTQIVWLLTNSGIAFFNGLISAMVTLAILPYLEGLFQFTTSLSLIEQANLDHPLMKRMMVTAPGTYQHSLMVATLAESAADAIKADSTLCRVGAYFHDIGKMKRPNFFVENQFNKENPHDALAPRMSKIIISAHATDGVEMGTKHKLPKVLLDFMREHHGTSLVSFFYSLALKEGEADESQALKESFRYPGPKPQFKESGIVMLADGVEAAVRSMDKPTLSKIEAMINRIFKDRIEDKQLDECPLSLKEIETIRQTFLNVFKGIYHSRLDYQEELNQIIDQAKIKSSSQ